MVKNAENEHKKWMTLHEVAAYLGFSYGYAQQIFPSWERYGVQAHRLPGGRRLLFDREQIDDMVRACAIN